MGMRSQAGGYFARVRGLPRPLWLAGLTALFSLISAAAVFSLGPGPLREAPPLLTRGEYALLPGADYAPDASFDYDREDLLSGPLFLADACHPLPGDYPAVNARTLRSVVGGYLPGEAAAALRPEAVYALCDMRAERNLEGVLITRGALSPAQVSALQLDAFYRRSAVMPLTQAAAQAAQAVPGPGHNEHQTGWAFDIALTGVLRAGQPDPLLQNDLGAWLSENAYRFGFVRRYPSGMEGCENVHFRYVGLEHALTMTLLGLGMEDYLAYLAAHPALTVKKGEETLFYIRYAGTESGAFSLPHGAKYRLSGDNLGGAVLVVIP